MAIDSGMAGEQSLRFISEDALLVEYGDTLDDSVHQKVRAMDTALRRSRIASRIETVPTFRSLLVKFDPFLLTPSTLLALVESLDASQVELEPGSWRVPVCMRGEHAEDLDQVSGLLECTPAELQERILNSTFKLYMYGFAPGFAYLGGLDPRLAVPRRATPRKPMPPGSLMIAGGLASLASVSMPTGWYVIGRTPVHMFSLQRTQLVPVSVGDTLDFSAVNPGEFARLEAAGERAGMKRGEG